MRKSAAIIRLRHLLGMTRAAEESRLAKAMAQIAACRARAARLHREIGAARDDAASPGAGLAAADLIAGSHWALRLVERADAEQARAVVLEAEAAVIREHLARAFGRETAAAAMSDKALGEERRLTARRAEEAMIAPRSAPKSPEGAAPERTRDQ